MLAHIALWSGVLIRSSSCLSEQAMPHAMVIEDSWLLYLLKYSAVAHAAKDVIAVWMYDMDQSK